MRDRLFSFELGFNIASVSFAGGIVELAKQVLLLALLAHFDVSGGILCEPEVLILSEFLAIAAQFSICSKENLSLGAVELRSITE